MSSEPTVRAVRRNGAQVELDLHIPASLDWFRGHFPRLPILPGVVQVDWAIRYGREHLPLAGEFRGMKNLKFTSPIQPDASITLALEARGLELAFGYRAGERAFSSGRIVFAATA